MQTNVDFLTYSKVSVTHALYMCTLFAFVLGGYVVILCIKSMQNTLHCHGRVDIRTTSYSDALAFDPCWDKCPCRHVWFYLSTCGNRLGGIPFLLPASCWGSQCKRYIHILLQKCKNLFWCCNNLNLNYDSVCGITSIIILFVVILCAQYFNY